MTKKDERRKDPRMALAVPIHVQGHEATGTPWTEMGRCSDATTAGLSFDVARKVQTGEILVLTVALPKRFRQHDLHLPSYKTYAIVKRVEHTAAGSRVGIWILGKTLPAWATGKPGTRYLNDRRKGGRKKVYLKVRLRREAHTGTEQEHTVLEDLSEEGARVMTALSFQEGDQVAVEQLEGDLHAYAEVRRIFTGKDGIRRVSLRFVKADASE